MIRYFWIAGTDTDVGKTLVTTYLMLSLQKQGKKVIPYKPVQTGIREDESDTAFYQSYSEVPFQNDHLNSYSFKKPASPHYAAKFEGAVIAEKTILEHIKQLKSMYDYVICEGAGGLYVPLDEQRNYHFLHLIKQSALPVILVTRTTLGTINHTLLSVEALKREQIPIAGIVFNAFGGTELERDNIITIEHLTGLPSLVIPQLEHLSELKSITLENTQWFERLILS